MMFDSDSDSLDLSIDEFPPTPGKSLNLSSYQTTSVPDTPDNMEIDSQPTPAQIAPVDKKERQKILLSDRARKMVWGELSKIKHLRTLASKAHILGKDIEQARADKSTLSMFSLKKHLPQLPGGDLTWAFQSEWENILTECSQKLMDATANYLLTEKVSTLGKKATEMAQKATLDFSKALPSDEKEKGLELFAIVDQSMKKLKKVKRVKDGKITKPHSKKTGKLQGKLKKNKAVARKLKM
jgi:hypothetical protein